jgi:hypothetical protein
MQVMIYLLGEFIRLSVIFIVALIYSINTLEEFATISIGYNIISFFLTRLPDGIKEALVGWQSIKRLSIFFKEFKCGDKS